MPMASAPSRESSSPDSPTRTPGGDQPGARRRRPGRSRRPATTQAEGGRDHRRQAGQRTGQGVGDATASRAPAALSVPVPPCHRDHAARYSSRLSTAPPAPSVRQRARAYSRDSRGVLAGLSPARRRVVLASLVALVRGRAAALAVVLVSRPSAAPAARAGRRRTGPARCCSSPATAVRTGSLQSLADRLTAAGRDATWCELPGNGTGDLAEAADALDDAVDARARPHRRGERRRRRLLGRRARRPALGGRRRRRRRPPGGHPGLAAPRHVARRPGRRRRARRSARSAAGSWRTDSDLLARLNAEDETPDGPTWVSIWTDAGPRPSPRRTPPGSTAR